MKEKNGSKGMNRVWTVIALFATLGLTAQAQASSEIEIPGATACFRALDLAIHASAIGPGKNPSDIFDLYPAPWAAVPGEFAGSQGAWIFNQNEPNQASFYTEELGFTPNNHGYFAEFWGAESTTIQEAAQKGKKVFGPEARDALATFLITRMSELVATHEKQKKSKPKGPIAPLTKVDQKPIKEVISKYLKPFTDAAMSQAVEAHFAALARTEQAERLDLTRASLGDSLKICAAIQGDARVSGIAAQFLQKVSGTQGLAPTVPASETEAGSAKN